MPGYYYGIDEPYGEPWPEDYMTDQLEASRANAFHVDPEGARYAVACDVSAGDGGPAVRRQSGAETQAELERKQRVMTDLQQAVTEYAKACQREADAYRAAASPNTNGLDAENMIADVFAEVAARLLAMVEDSARFKGSRGA